jgi:hypothetical protein
MSSVGYTYEEFILLEKVMKNIDRQIKKQESTILLHDTDEWVLTDSDFSHMRKVVNCYNEEFVKKLEATHFITKYEQEKTELYNTLERKKANNEDYKEADAAWWKSIQKVNDARNYLKNENNLYELILKNKYNIDARTTIDGSSIYKYSYFPKQRSESHFVTDTWWYHYFNRTLPCARGRVLQHAGTCWFNSILNTMLLSTPVKKYLEQTLKFSESIRPYTTNHQNDKHQDDGWTFTYTTPATITLIDGANKSDVENHYLELRKKVNANVFSDPFKAFFYNRLGKGYNLHGNTLFLDDKVLLSLSKLINPVKDDGGHSDLIYRLFDILSLPYEYHKMSLEKLGGTLYAEYAPSIKEYLNKSTKQFVLICSNDTMYCGKDSLPLQVGSYHLEAAGINSMGHAIIGLHCNGIPYMYDSNNIIAPSNWPESDFSGYFEKVMEVMNNPIQYYNYMINFSFFLYCK